MSVFIESSNIISSLGFSTEENYKNVCSGISGIKAYVNSPYSAVPLQASIIDQDRLKQAAAELLINQDYTRFEQICILSISNALQNSIIDIKSPRTIVIVSTTKGNIELLADARGFSPDRVYLWKAANVIANFFSAANTPVVVSNACISGLSAMLLAKRLITSKKYDHAVVVGADVVSRFIVSGFQSFMSLSPLPCKPFDEKRDGLSLGEAAATVVITNKSAKGLTEIVNGSINNDANHISGPSRTGEGLFAAISHTLGGKGVDFISAHGTATPYNDNMEAVAISRAGLNQTPVNSLKGYFGHTLGAAGLLESIISIEAMKANSIIKTMGFETNGVTEPINIADITRHQTINSVLKLASGFGGCNAAVLLKKI
jgi:3-oxoacyl-[acyl-carrier-protein] synthase-1